MKQGFKVLRSGEKTDFNLGVVVESLQGVGLSTNKAIQLARTLEKHFRDKKAKTVKLETLVAVLGGLIEEDAGPEVAERFRQQPPPFAPLSVSHGEDESSAAFSRRTLAGMLEKQGFSFKESNVLARQVEGELRRSGADLITPLELTHQTALVIGSRFGPETRARFEASTGQPSELWVVQDDGVRVPYSRGILAQSLMALGLSPDLSYQLAKRAELRLWRLGRYELSISLLRQSVKRVLLQDAGEEFVRRYELLHALRRPERPLIILIGGAPGVGKSNLASALAYRLGIPRIVSTDAIRQALRSLISAELSPELHTSSFAAWRAELLPSESPKPKRKRVVRGFQRQVQQLTAPLEAIVARSLLEATSLVMEGIHLVPGFIPSDALEGAIIVELMLMVSDPELHKSYFGVREVQTRSQRRLEHYLEHFDEIRMIQDFCLTQARAENVPIIEATDFDTLLEQAIEHILNAALATDSVPLETELEALTQELVPT